MREGKILEFTGYGCLMLIVVLLICFDRANSERSEKINGYEQISYKKACVEGKEVLVYGSYTKYGRGIALNFDFEGKPVPCENNGELK